MAVDDPHRKDSAQKIQEGESADLRACVVRLESDMDVARESIKLLELEIATARVASFDSENQIENARNSSRDLEAQVDGARRNDQIRAEEISVLRLQLDGSMELAGAWRERAVSLQRSLQNCQEDRNPLESLAQLPHSSRVIEDWPLRETIAPAEFIHRTAGHGDRKQFARSRKPGLDTLLEIVRQSGLDLDGLRRVLDFGCGSGRTIAAWEPYTPRIEVCGVDLDPDLIDWCRENLPFAHVECNGLEPPLSFPAGHFDLVYAASVFTHLTEQSARAWVEELHRLVRHGGIVVASFHSPHYHDALDGDRLAELAKTGYLVMRTGKHSTEGSNNYAAFYTVDSIRSLFAGWKECGAHFAAERGPSDFASHQDVMVFRRSR